MPTRPDSPLARRLGAAVATTLLGLGAFVAAPPAADAAAVAAPAFATGDNTYGQLGSGTGAGTATPTPVALPADTDLTQVAAGQYASYGLTATGQVLAWGRGTLGALGNGAETDSPTPVAVHIPAGTAVTEIAAGTGFALALTNAGHVYAWGDDGTGQLGDGATTTTGQSTPQLVHIPSGTTVTHLAAGNDFAVALTSTGGVLTWGNNTGGELGDGTTTVRTSPVPVALPAGVVTIRAVGAGAGAGYAVTSAGAVLSWGNGAVGELGNGTTAGSIVPVPVTLPAGTSIRSIDGGGGYALAVTTDGQLLGWGGGKNGDLGQGNTAAQLTPVTVPLPAGTVVTAASAGSGISTAVTSGGAAYAWGTNAYGQLGDGTTSTRLSPVPVAVPGAAHVTGASAGGQHLLILTPPPPVVSHVSPAIAPTGGGTLVTVTGSHLLGTRQVSFGAKHARIIAVTPDTVTVKAPAHAVGTVHLRVTTTVGSSPRTAADRFSWVAAHSVIGWGFDRYGQLGDAGGSDARNTPVAGSLATVLPSTISVGAYAAYGISSTGRVLAWGDNTYGELGNGTTTSSTTPVPVALPAGTTVTAVVAGDQDAYALTAAGTVFGWGYNYDGELGNGTRIDSTTPVRVQLPAKVRVTQLSAGYGHALARTAAGGVLGWGYNHDGELGNGRTTNALRPVAVHLPAGTRVTQVAAGYYHGLALTAAGTVLAWGDNSQGALGDGTTVTRLTPVRVDLPAGTTVTQLSAGFLFSSALTAAHTVLDWGDNAFGELADGTTTDRHTPVPAVLPAGTSISRIAALYYGVDALAATGRVYTWGYNVFGELGDDTTTASALVPTQVVLPPGITVTRLAGYGDTSIAELGSAPGVRSASPHLRRTR